MMMGIEHSRVRQGRVEQKRVGQKRMSTCPCQNIQVAQTQPIRDSAEMISFPDRVNSFYTHSFMLSTAREDEYTFLKKVIAVIVSKYQRFLVL